MPEIHIVRKENCTEEEKKRVMEEINRAGAFLWADYIKKQAEEDDKKWRSR